MPPEIDDRGSTQSTASVFDLLSFHQGFSANENNQAAKPEQDKITFTNPYLHSVLPALDSRPNPFDYHQKGDAKPALPLPSVDIKPNTPDSSDKKPIEPKPFVPPTDVKPLPAPDGTDGAYTLPFQPDKSPIVQLYERKQGARQAGSGGALPPIDAIPNPSDLIRPVQPTPGPDLRPSPSPEVKPSPGPEPWPRPNPKPPDLIPKPLDDIKPTDYRPDPPSDLINKLEPKYETSDVGKAVRMAKELGVPLAVHIGASWCHYCVEMERKTWPSVEGSASKQGSLQGKMVVLHLDVDQQRSLRGEDARLASELTKNRGTSVPIIRVFKVDSQGAITKTNENRGAINSQSKLEEFLVKGGVRK